MTFSCPPGREEQSPGRSSVWLERCVRDAEVASSNLVAPMKEGPVRKGWPFFHWAAGLAGDLGSAGNVPGGRLVIAEMLSGLIHGLGEREI